MCTFINTASVSHCRVCNSPYQPPSPTSRFTSDVTIDSDYFLDEYVAVVTGSEFGSIVERMLVLISKTSIVLILSHSLAHLNTIPNLLH